MIEVATLNEVEVLASVVYTRLWVLSSLTFYVDRDRRAILSPSVQSLCSNRGTIHDRGLLANSTKNADVYVLKERIKGS